VAGRLSKLRPTMPNFVEKYSAEMRAALYTAVLEREQTLRATLRAAAAGELPDLGAEDQATLAGMAYGYAAQLVADERLRRAGNVRAKKDTDATARGVAARLLALADREARLLEAAPAKRPVDTGRAVGAAKLAREAVALVHALDAGPKTAPAKTDTKGAEQRKPRSLAARIAAESSAEQDDPNAPTHADGASGLDVTSPENDDETRTNAGPVRLRIAKPSAILAYGAGGGEAPA
jgi:hypothetical protein